MLVAVCADRGAPGATSTALTLGAAWPGEAYVVEADPYGGDLGVRVRTGSGGWLPPTPTVLTLAAAARTAEGDPYAVGRYVSRLTPRLSVLPGHLSAEQAEAIGQAWSSLASVLTASATDVVVDLGRIHSGSPSMPVAAAADAVVVVVRGGDGGALIHLRERLGRLVPALADRAGRPVEVLPVVIGPARHAGADVDQVAEVLSASPVGPLVEQVGHLAWDPEALRRVVRSELASGRLGRTALLRTARQLTTRLTAAADESAGVA